MDATEIAHDQPLAVLTKETGWGLEEMLTVRGLLLLLAAKKNE